MIDVEYATMEARAVTAEAERDEARAALSALYAAGVQVVDVSNPNLAEERRKLSRLLDKYERQDRDWRKAVHAWIARAETAETALRDIAGTDDSSRMGALRCREIARAALKGHHADPQ